VDHTSTDPVAVPNTTMPNTSSSSNTSSEVGATGAVAKQRRLYIHGSKSTYTGSLGSHAGLGSRSVTHIARNVFTSEPITPTSDMDSFYPTSNINAGIGISGTLPIRPLGLASRQRFSSVARPLPPISPGGRI